MDASGLGWRAPPSEALSLIQVDAVISLGSTEMSVLLRLKRNWAGGLHVGKAGTCGPACNPIPSLVPTAQKQA